MQLLLPLEPRTYRTDPGPRAGRAEDSRSRPSRRTSGNWRASSRRWSTCREYAGHRAGGRGRTPAREGGDQGPAGASWSSGPRPVAEHHPPQRRGSSTARPATRHSFDELDKLLDAQVYRLSHWKAADDEINYRRFFDINDLAAVCMEDPAVFAESHRLVFDLLVRGDVDGLRIDHIDGLYDPLEYLRRLQAGYLRGLGRTAYEHDRGRRTGCPAGRSTGRPAGQPAAVCPGQQPRRDGRFGRRAGRGGL